MSASSDEVIRLLNLKFEACEELAEMYRVALLRRAAAIEGHEVHVDHLHDVILRLAERQFGSLAELAEELKPAHPESLNAGPELIAAIPDGGQVVYFRTEQEAAAAAETYSGSAPVLRAEMWQTHLGATDPAESRFWAQLFAVRNPDYFRLDEDGYWSPPT